MIKTVVNLDEEEYLSLPNRRSVVNEFYRYEFLKLDTKGDRRVVNITVDVYGSISSHHGLELATGLKVKKITEHQMEMNIGKKHKVQTLTYFHNKADEALKGNVVALKSILEEFLLFTGRGNFELAMIDLITEFHFFVHGKPRNTDSCLLINHWFKELDRPNDPLLMYPPTFTLFEIFQNHRRWGLHEDFKDVLCNRQKLNNTFTMMANSQPGVILR